METTYYDPAVAGSFGGVDSLRRGSKSTFAQARNWLSSQDTYTLHKPVRRRFKRRKVLVPGINHLWQADLVDVSALAVHNDGFRYLLTVIDCFSRYAFVVPLKSKSSINVKNAFASILSDDDYPTYIQTDKGTEFFNAPFQTFLKANNIRHYASESDNKACIVERFNRTLKNKMWRYFTYKKTHRYLDVLDQLVESYNNSYHRTIKTQPSAVNLTNEKSIFKIIYGKTDEKKIKYKFAVGDTVRISESRRPFERGYNAKWTYELFTVARRLPTKPPTYELKDLNGEDIKGAFYAEEMQKVTKSDNIFRIEKVLGTRKRNGKIQYLVRWLGYSDKFDSYVDDILTSDG